MKSHKDLFFLTFAWLLFVTVHVSADDTIRFHYVLGRGCRDLLGQAGYNENYFGECGRVVDGDFYGQNLKGKRLRGASLVAANFGKADLTNADLRGADLTDANIFQRANFTGALIDKWTRLPISTDDIEKFGMVWFDASMANMALLDALQTGSRQEVMNAIDNLADLTQGGRVLEYALNKSIDASNPGIVKLLLEKGTDPNVHTSNHPLNMAFNCFTLRKGYSYHYFHQDKNRCLNAISLLLQFGANPFDESESHRPTFWWNILKRRDRTDLGLDAYVLLKNYGKVTKKLLETSVLSSDCYYIPTWVVRNGSLLTMLVEDGAPLHPLSGCASDNSKAPFKNPLIYFFHHFSSTYPTNIDSDDVVRGTIDLWETYAKLGFDLFDPVDPSKPETAFVYSALKGWATTSGLSQNPRIQVFKLMKRLGYDLRATKMGMELSHLLASSGYIFDGNGSNFHQQLAEFEFLKDEGITFSEKNAIGDVPLITLSRRNKTKMTKFDWHWYSMQVLAFAKLDLDWNVRSDFDGETPLCLLTQRYEEELLVAGSLDLIMEHILKKADKNFTNKAGKRPVEYCQSTRCKDLLK